YSSDVRFSGTKRFESSGKLERDDTTDENGAARLSLDPAVEPTAQPRTYVVEATVTGPDDQTVTNTKHVVALPPFVLGLKVPRYLERATEVAPAVIVVGPSAGGAEPVTWAKPATRVFEVATDKEAYDPGETAALVLKSPFQEGRALAVTEGPEGNTYQWLEVKGGSATLKVPVRGT